MATTKTLEEPTTTTINNAPIAKKWNWDRSKQSVRKAIAEDAFFIQQITHVVQNTDGGASVTDAMKYVAESLKNEAQHDHGLSPIMEQYNTLTQTDKRLVVRKILHTKYRAGEYKLVEATSTYRSGKKSGTLKYIIA